MKNLLLKKEEIFLEWITILPTKNIILMSQTLIN